MNKEKLDNLDQIQQIIEKFQIKKFEALSLEDLAIALTTKEFPQIFKKITNEDWNLKYKIKAQERIRNANFDIQWLTTKSSNIYHPLFSNAEKGYAKKIKEYFNIYGKQPQQKRDIINCVNMYQKNPLHLACQNGHLEAVQELVKFGFNPNQKDKYGKTPLMYACQNGFQVIVNYLTKNGGNLNLEDSQNKNCLHIAVTSNSPDLVTEILQQFPNMINSEEIAGFTPLHLSVGNATTEQINIMRILLEKGANVNAPDNKGETPLIHASRSGKIKAAKILLANGASIQAKEHGTGKQVLDVACTEQMRQAILLFGNKQIYQDTQLQEKDKKYLKQTMKAQEPTINMGDGHVVHLKEAPKQINPYQDVKVSPLLKFFRGKFYTMLKQLQEDGIQNWKHLNYPNLYTASWMEGINSLENLLEMVKNIDPCEAIMKCFNLLCPYENDLPLPPQFERLENDEFYAKKWFENMSLGYQRTGLTENTRTELDKLKKKIEELENLLDYKIDEYTALEIKYNEIQNEVHDFRKNKKIFEEQLLKQKADYESLIDKLTKDNKNKENQLKLLQIEKESLEFEQENAGQEEVKKLQGKINKLEKKIQNLSEDLENEKNSHVNTKKLLNQDIEQLRKLLKQEQEKQKKAEEEQEKEKKHKEEIKEHVEKNLDPTEALINMHKNLDKQKEKKTIIQRMQEVDIDKSGKLSSLEFMLFCERLGLDQLETKVLQKLAGILDGEQKLRDEIELEAWKDIAENNDKIKKIWNQRLYGQILKKIEEKKLDFEFVSQQLDPDNDNKIEPKELQRGLDSLKIFLNKKDAINSFNNLDVDGNGAITVQEFTSTLQKYWEEIQSPLNPELKFEYRFLPDYYDYAAPQVIDDNGGEYNGMSEENQEQRIKLNPDVTPINGNLLVQIPFGKNLINQSQEKQITIRTILKGSGAIEKNLINSIIQFDQKSWNYSIMIPVRDVLKENVNDTLHIMLYSNEDSFITDEYFMGEVKVLWKKCIENPEKWLISNTFQIGNFSFLKEHPKEVTGSLAVQTQWIPSDSPKFVGEIRTVDLLEQQPNRKQFNRSIVEKGMLEVSLVSAYLQDKKQKIKCKIQLNKEEKIFKAKYDINKQPYWGEKTYFDLKESTNKLLDAVKITLFQDNGTFSSDEILGEIFVDWEECLDWVGEYLTRKAYLFKAHQQQKDASKIYVKIRWIPNSLYQKLTGYKDISERDKKKSIQASKEDLQCGTLKIVALGAKNLRPDDGKTSDPYAIFKFQNFDNEYLKFQSKVKGKTLNPVWNEQFSFDVQFFKEAPVPPLQILIKDQDTFGDDDLGTVDIDLNEVIENPCEWLLDDQNFEIDDPKLDPKKVSEKPTFNLCAYFVPEGTKDPNKKPKTWRDDKTVKGKLKINVVHARELRVADSKSSDPFTQITFPNGQEKKTSVISSSLNPIWNSSFQEDVLVSLERMNTVGEPIKICVKDSDTLATDDILGYCNIQWKKCIENPGQWAINEIFELTGTPDIKKKLKTLGYIYIQIKFLEEGMEDDGKEPECIENLAEILSQQQGVFKGNLRVFLVHAKELADADNGKKDFSDPYVIFKVAGGKKVQSKTIKDSLNPIWEIIYDIPIIMPQDAIQPMRMEIFDDDLVGDELLGYVGVDILETLKNPGKWKINQSFKLQGDNEMKKKYKIKNDNLGEIYIQVMFVPDGMKITEKPLPLNENLNDILRKQKEDDKTPMDGILKVNIVCARGLKMADRNSSDPYCIVQFPDGKELQTKEIPENLDPIWNFQAKYKIKFNKEDYKPLKFTVKDNDALAVDDTLGTVQVDWMECFENPVMWQVNQLFKLQGDTKGGKNLGDIYIQIQYIPEAQIEDPTVNTFCKTNPDLVKWYGRILGNLEIKIISALDVKNADWGGKSDPLIEAYLSHLTKNKIITPAIQNNLNPVWNYEGRFFIDLFRCQVQDKEIIFDLYDEDTVSNELIGQASIDLIDCLEKPGLLIEQDYVLQDPKKKDLKTNYGSIKLGYKWLPDKDCESIEGLREPEKIYQGEIFLKIVSVRGLKKQMKTLVNFEFTNQLKKWFKTKSRSQKETDPKFDEQFTQKLNITQKQLKILMIHFKIEEDGMLTDSILGGFSVNLREIVENPGQWLSGYFEIQQIQYKENEEIIKSNGHCGIMIQFRPENKPADFDTKEPELENYEQMIERGKPVTEPGILYVNVIGARKIPDSTFDTPDAFVTIKCSKGNKKEIKTKTIHDNLSPVWDHKDQIELDLPKEQYEHFQLFITLYDYNYTINSNLGKIDLDISHLFAKPGEWLNQILPILDKKGFPGAGELYLQIQWVPNSQKNTIKTEAPEHLFLKEKKEQDEKIKQQKAEKQKEAQELDVEGIIFVKVVQAFNLLEGAKTDGKVTIKVNKGSNQIFNTKEIKNNQNPEFQQEFNIEIKARPNEIKSGLALSATVEDIDFIGNDFLGFLEVDLSNYIQNPNLWFNEISQLSDAKGQVGKNGMLYLQIQWRPKGIQNQNTELPKLRSIKEYQKGADPKGIVVVKVVKANNILGVEKKGSYSDAKLRIKFNKQKETTKIVKSLNPEWNEQFQFKINFRERSEIPFAYCEILDNNTFSDTFLGDFEANISEILDEPNKWKIKKEYTLANMEKQKTKGDISGTAELWFAFVQNEKDIANLQ